MNHPLLGFLRAAGIVFFGVLGAAAYLVLAERKLAGYFQERYGPNRVGPFGLLQPLADLIKLVFKEEVVFPQSNRWLYLLAPGIIAVMALLPLAVIPFAPHFAVTDINVALLYVLAAASLGTYGVLLGGWASNNKYSLIGGLRTANQMISYEIAMALALVGVVLMAGSLSLKDIVAAQQHLWYLIPQFLGFVVFLVSMFAETNRAPFDLPEAEAELVAGYHTEYSSMKFAMFFVGEYIHMVVAAALMTALYLGGWYGPWKPGFHWFALKMALVLYLMIWVRWTYPRFRFDQLMRFGWKVLIPLALVNLGITGLVLLR